MVDSEEKKLNQEQLAAIRYGKGPLLIIAGAGTGKTTVVTERIKWLVAKGLAKPAEILALTFTDKAAREMEERVDVAMPYGYTEMWIATFHAFCDRVLRAEAINIGLNPRYNLLTSAETIQFIRTNFFKFKLNYFRPLGNPYKFIQGMLQHFSRLKDEDVMPVEYSAWTKKQKGEEAAKYLELSRAYQTYEDLKVKESVADFSDLIASVLRLFRTRKNILRQYQERFKYVLVDEFQDTNYAQNELAILLAGPKQNITVCADDDQAIYRWRGASISNVIQFKKRFPKAKLISLTKNYRSTQEILDRAYQLIQNNNPDRLEVKENVDKKLVATRQATGVKVSLIYQDRVENEAEMVAEEIKNLIRQRGGKNLKYEDMAILVRANNQAEPFIKAFNRLGIPCQFLGPGMLFRQPEVKDLVAYLKVLANFEDSVAMYRVLTMDIFGLPSRDLAAILNFAKRNNLSLFEAAEQVGKIFLTPKAQQIIGQIVTMIYRHLERIKKETAGQILYYFLQDSGLLPKMVQYQTVAEERRAQNIAKFFDRLKTYEVEHEDASVFAVSDWIDLSMDLGESPLAADLDWTQNNAVNILTIHSAKGLEFPVVFLVNLVAERFPTRQRQEQIPIPEALIKEILPTGDFHLQEERRLFYVGMTRARDRLFLTAANYYGEGKRERKLSPFVFESLGEEIVANLRKIPPPESQQLSILDWQKPAEPPSAPAASFFPVTYLSYSQIDTFRRCPLHYKLKFILRIPTPASAAQSFGSSVHYALRDYYRGLIAGQKFSEKDFLGLLEKNWLKEGYTSRWHERLSLKKAQKALISFFAKNKDSKVVPLLVEQPFIFPLGDLRVGGRIDRVDPAGGGIEIIDYKTGARVPSQKEIDVDLQMTIYALAATNVREKPFGRQPQEVTLSFYYFETGEKISTVRTAAQLAKAREEIKSWAEKIATSDFQCQGSEFCRYCEYRLLCEESAS